MSIKKLITGLTLSLLLASPVANADWGDVYYCQMTNFVEITLEGEKKYYKQERFQFKLDQTKNAMVFGSTGAFGDLVAELTEGSSFPSYETWDASRYRTQGAMSKHTSITFNVGKLLLAHYEFNNVAGVSADCEKF